MHSELVARLRAVSQAAGQASCRPEEDIKARKATEATKATEAKSEATDATEDTILTESQSQQPER